MNTEREKRHIVDILFVLALFLVFTLSTLTLVLFGANIYQNTVNSMEDNYNARTVCSYISGKFRSNDSAGDISIGSIDGQPSLILNQEINDASYSTYIYEYDDLFCVWQNSLCEDNATINIDLDFFEKIGENTYERFSESFQEKAYSDETIEKLLNEAGFELVNRYEEMTRNKPTETTQRTVYVARRLPR